MLSESKEGAIALSRSQALLVLVAVWSVVTLGSSDLPVLIILESAEAPPFYLLFLKLVVEVCIELLCSFNGEGITWDRI